MFKSQVEKLTFDKTLTEILSHLPTYVFCGYSFINKAIETTEPQEFFIFKTKFNKTKFQLLLPSVFEIQANPGTPHFAQVMDVLRKQMDAVL